MVKSNEPELTQSPNRKKNKTKPVGLFDHLKQIREVQDPNYFKKLSEHDRKSFNHFIILKALSMNPENLDVITTLYKYFDIIPSPQFYQLLISVIPQDSTYYPWIKPKNRFEGELIDIFAKRFEVSNSQAEEYINLLSLTDEGINSLVQICQGFGKTEKEIEELLSKNNEDEQ